MSLPVFLHWCELWNSDNPDYRPTNSNNRPSDHRPSSDNRRSDHHPSNDNHFRWDLYDNNNNI